MGNVTDLLLQHSVHLHICSTIQGLLSLYTELWCHRMTRLRNEAMPDMCGKKSRQYKPQHSARYVWKNKDSKIPNIVPDMCDKIQTVQTPTFCQICVKKSRQYTPQHCARYVWKNLRQYKPQHCARYVWKNLRQYKPQHCSLLFAFFRRVIDTVLRAVTIWTETMVSEQWIYSLVYYSWRTLHHAALSKYFRPRAQALNPRSQHFCWLWFDNSHEYPFDTWWH